MNIEIGDAKQIAELVKTALKVCGELKNDGSLERIFDMIFAARARLRADAATLDLLQFDKYVGGGMSPQDAAEIIRAQKCAVALNLEKFLSLLKV